MKEEEVETCCLKACHRKVFRDSGFCRKCCKKVLQDIEYLVHSPQTVKQSTASKWLKKYGHTSYELFIGGHFNSKPEKLLFNGETLGKLSLKSFRKRFKNDKCLYT